MRGGFARPRPHGLHGPHGLRIVLAEFLGTALLLCAVVGSGIMGERLAAGNAAVALLANTLATVFALFVLIECFGPVSGAHFNPLVSLLMAARGTRPWRHAPLYLLAQCAGAIAGVVAAHGMFGLPLLEISTQGRSGVPLVWSEFLASIGLLITIVQCERHQPSAIPMAVGAYISAAYWFTASTSFANPAVTMARALTDTFAGISPASVPGFLLGQFLALAVLCLCIGRQQHGCAGAPGTEQGDGQLAGILQVQRHALHTARLQGAGQAQGALLQLGVVERRRQRHGAAGQGV